MKRSAASWLAAAISHWNIHVYIQVAKTKALIRFVFTAKLVVFVFAHAKRLVSHDVAHIIISVVYVKGSNCFMNERDYLSFYQHWYETENGRIQHLFVHHVCAWATNLFAPVVFFLWGESFYRALSIKRPTQVPAFLSCRSTCLALQCSVLLAHGRLHVFKVPCLQFSSCIAHQDKMWAPAWENQQCGFWPGLTQTRLCCHWRWLGAWNFGFRK